MIESLINKVFFLIFFMCIFNIVRHIWEIVRRLRVEDGWKKKYEISTTDLVLFILSISYLLSTIFVGIKI